MLIWEVPAKGTGLCVRQVATLQVRTTWDRAGGRDRVASRWVRLASMSRLEPAAGVGSAGGLGSADHEGCALRECNGVCGAGGEPPGESGARFGVRDARIPPGRGSNGPFRRSDRPLHSPGGSRSCLVPPSEPRAPTTDDHWFRASRAQRHPCPAHPATARVVPLGPLGRISPVPARPDQPGAGTPPARISPVPAPRSATAPRAPRPAGWPRPWRPSCRGSPGTPTRCGARSGSCRGRAADRPAGSAPGR
jgi:hypothetical protein